jgi:hypothetical protein
MKLRIAVLKIAGSLKTAACLRIAELMTWKIAQSLKPVESLSLQIAGNLKQIAVGRIADCLPWMSWIVAWKMIVGRIVVVAQIFAWIVARAAVVLAPAIVVAAAVVVVEVAIAVVVEAFADRVQIYSYAACGLNDFS